MADGVLFDLAAGEAPAPGYNPPDEAEADNTNVNLNWWRFEVG